MKAFISLVFCSFTILFSCVEHDIDIAQNSVENHDLLLDDMIFTPEQLDILSQDNSFKAASKEVFTKWHNCTVTYKIDQNNSPQNHQLQTLFSAMRDIEAFSGVRFKYATLHAPRSSYMLITTMDDPGGRATVGKVSKSRIEIGPTQFTTRAARHELLHILGIVHEHQRSDAHTYINFHEENMRSEWKEFILPKSNYEGFGTLDFGSIMIYSSFAGITNPESCCSCNRATWTKMDGTCLGERSVSTNFSQKDKDHVNFLYPCTVTGPSGGGNEQ